MVGRRACGYRVGWYEPVAENVHTVRKGVCNGGVKNALRWGETAVVRECGGCREKLKGGGERKDSG